MYSITCSLTVTWPNVLNNMQSNSNMTNMYSITCSLTVTWPTCTRWCRRMCVWLDPLWWLPCTIQSRSVWRALNKKQHGSIQLRQTVAPTHSMFATWSPNNLAQRKKMAVTVKGIQKNSHGKWLKHKGPPPPHTHTLCLSFRCHRYSLFVTKNGELIWKSVQGPLKL